MRFFVSLVLLLTLGCTPQREFRHLQGEMLGTYVDIKANLTISEAKSLQRDLIDIDKRMKAELSIFNEKSRLSRINSGQDLSLTPWLVYNIRLADSVSRLSRGVYDITVAPLVEAYGFGREAFDKNKQVNRDSLLQFVGYEKISIKDNKLVKEDDRVKVDLNSIAKGFGVDVVAEYLSSLDCEDYMVEIGGELRLSGSNPKGESWTIGVESPVDGNYTREGDYEVAISIPPASDLRAIATSGNYRRFHITQSGEKIVHTIDPRTGEAKASSLVSVTVLAPSCALADAYATMLLAAGDEGAEKLAQEIENCEVLLIYINRYENQEYKLYLSEGMKRYVTK